MKTDWKSVARRVAAWTLYRLSWLLIMIASFAGPAGRRLSGVASRVDPTTVRL